MKKCNVISHRGANRVAPQNTMPAFRKSVQYNVDGFETDIHLTLDGVPVICHNYSVDKTSDGKGLIAAKTLEELRQLDFGTYFHPSYKGTLMPTLEELLILSEKVGLKVLNLEIKSPENKDYTVVDKTIEAVKAHNLFDSLIISCFDPDLLVYTKDLDENCKTGFLYDPAEKISLKMMKKPFEYAKSIGVDALHPHIIYINEKYVEEAHEKGFMVNPWTVNSEKDIRKCIECGTDGIITDVPNVVNKILEDYDFD